MAVYNTTTGITRNPFHIIDAVEFMGEDAYEEYEETAKDYSVAKVIGPDQVIMDTGYMDVNEFLGLHHTYIKWYTGVGDGNEGIVLEYWWIDPEGNEDSYSISATYDEDTSTTTGDGRGLAYFHDNYQYRFVVKSSDSIRTDDYVAVDYIKLSVLNQNVAQAEYADISTSSPGVPAVQIERAGYTNYNASGSTYTYNVTVGIGATPQYFFPTITAYNSLGIAANVISWATGLPYFVARVWRTNETHFSGNVTVFWKASCWESVQSLK